MTLNEKRNIEQDNSKSNEQIKKEVQEKDINEIRRIAVEMMQKTKII